MILCDHDRAMSSGRVDYRQDGAGREEGFILIAVLWLLVALGAVGIHAGLQMRTERLAVANVLDEVHARQWALAGAEYARSHLTAALFGRGDELRAETARAEEQLGGTGVPGTRNMFQMVTNVNDPWRDPQELVTSQMRFGYSTFSLQLRDAQSVLNLNVADAEMLTGFFSQGLGLDFARADRLAQAISDWRDEDDIPRVGGAEREEYLSAAAAMLPPNQYFADLDELRYVLGMTPEIFEAARPYLTIQNSGRINVNAAPGPVLHALPGMTPEAVQEILRLRESGYYPTSLGRLISTLPGGMGKLLQSVGRRFTARATFRTSEVEIVSEGGLEGSPVMARVRYVVVRSNTGARVAIREFR